MKINDIIVDKIIENKKNKHKRKLAAIISTVAILLVISAYLMYAEITDLGVPVKRITIPGEGEYLTFSIDHNIVTANYKYYGYGYNISLKDAKGNWLKFKNGKTQYFLSNAEGEFSDTNSSVEKVKVSVAKIYEILGVDPKYFYHDGLTIYLNARMGTLVNGVLKYVYDTLEGNATEGLNILTSNSYFMPTGDESNHCTYAVPLNPTDKNYTDKQGNAIKEGIKNSLFLRYGINWSDITMSNLKQNFGIHYELDPVKTRDAYQIRYVDEKGNMLKATYPPNSETGFADATINDELIYPDVIDGYEFTYNYKLQTIKNDVIITTSNGTYTDESGVNIPTKTETTQPLKYILTFEYKEIPPPPLDGYTKYKVKYMEEETNKEISNTDFLSPNEFKTEEIIPKIIYGYEYLNKWKYDYCREDGLVLLSKEGCKNKPSIEITQEKNYYVIYFYYKKTLETEPDDDVENEVCRPRVFGKSYTKNIYMTDSEFDSLEYINANVLVGVNTPYVGYTTSDYYCNGVHKITNISLNISDISKIVDCTNTYSNNFPITVQKASFRLDTSELSDEKVYSYLLPYSSTIDCCCGGQKLIMMAMLK